MLKINSHGLRSDKNYPYAKGDKPRIAIMGDWYTLGFGVNNGKTFSVFRKKIIRVRSRFLTLASAVTERIRNFFYMKTKSVNITLMLS